MLGGVIPSPSPSTTAELAGSTVSIDPTLLALLPIVGVLATVVGGFVGAWIQSRREHRKWLRERRFDAYVEILTLHNEIQAASIALASLPPGATPEQRSHVLDVHTTLAKSFPAAVVPLSVLGPQVVTDAGGRVIAAINAKDRDAVSAAETALLVEMRKAVGIPA